MKNTDIKIKNPLEFIAKTAKLAGLKTEDITGPSKVRYMVDIRALVVRILRDEWKMSYPSMGRFLNRNHATVMRLYRRKPSAEFQIPDDPLKKVIKELSTGN